MPDLTPVDNDPFDVPPPGIPVDHDPFQPQQLAPSSGLAQQVSGFPQRAADLGMAALGPIGEAGMTVGDWMRTGGQSFDPRDVAPTVAGVMMGVAAPEAEEAAPLEAGAEAVAKGITAYHGSPYDFDKFDLSKIGTGEGAQAYGHGLYFAENPDVAAEYRRQLTAPGGDKFVGGEPYDRDDPAHLASFLSSSVYKNSSDPRQTAIDELTHDIGNQAIVPERRAIYQKALDLLNSGQDLPPFSRVPKGKTYQVSINADPEHFLDWDKPLSEQPQKVQDIANQHGADLNQPGQSLYRRITKYTYPIRDNPQSPWKGSGAQTYDDALAMVGGDKSRVLKLGNYDPSDAARQLRQAGIPGIKYLDQGSRGSGNGTRNYVVFDDRLIDIIKKYGMAGLIAGGAAHFSTTPVDHDPFAKGGEQQEALQ